MAFPVWILAIWMIPAVADAAVGGEVPAMFVFGDSLVDPGNNNNLNTLAKANFYPNGIDFPAGVTGRFCNGATVADHLGYLLGLPLVSRFIDLKSEGTKMLKGANYASAAGGILKTTGKLFGQLYSMDEQIQNYENSMAKLEAELKGINREVGNFLAKSLFFICIGSNDYLNDYLFRLSSTSEKYTLDQFHELVMQNFSRQLKRLYDMGGRKFLVTGLGPLGCIPNQIGNSGKNTSECVEKTNEMALQFNTKLRNTIKELNINLAGAYFLYWDIYSPTKEIIDNPASYGFKYAHKACCGGGRAKGQILCLPLLPAECQDRSQFVFWDPYHTTDAFNAISAKQAYQGKLQDTYPMNVKELIQL